MKVELKLFPTFIYNITFWGFFKLWQASIIVTKNKLIEKAFGFIKFREIQILDIQEIGYIKNKWVKNRLSAIYISDGILLTYKEKGKIKKNYIITASEQLNSLVALLQKIREHSIIVKEI